MILCCCFFICYIHVQRNTSLIAQLQFLSRDCSKNLPALLIVTKCHEGSVGWWSSRLNFVKNKFYTGSYSFYLWTRVSFISGRYINVVLWWSCDFSFNLGPLDSRSMSCIYIQVYNCLKQEGKQKMNFNTGTVKKKFKSCNI
jgi:hypothetical protein